MLTNLPKRSATITIRITPADREAIIARAQRAGKSVSDYVRGAALHYLTPADAPNQPDARSRTTTWRPASSDGRAGA